MVFSLTQRVSYALCNRVRCLCCKTGPSTVAARKQRGREGGTGEEIEVERARYMEKPQLNRNLINTAVKVEAGK